MVRLVFGLIFATATFFLLVPVLRWRQTGKLKRFERNIGGGTDTIIYTGYKATARGIGNGLSGLLNAVLAGLVLLNPTPNLGLVWPILIVMAIILLVGEVVGFFVSGTQERE